MERIKPSNKLNLSIMDEKLSILNSDIEELYKKYVEKKKLRRIREKSEKSLASRINFLIDEERKIRNQIENNLSKNHRCSKNWSVKMLRAPELITQYSNIRYNTIESNDESPNHAKLKINNSKKGNIKARYINNINKIEKIYESDTKNKQFAEMIKKNGLNDITLSSIQNNSSFENNNNITIGNRSNVTNNVCIIINNSEQNNSKNKINNNISIQDISFADKDIDINENITNEKSKIFNKDNDEKNNNQSKIYFQESENKNRINNEINYIKMRLASKINEENMQSISHTYEQNNEISLGSQNKSNLYINEMTAKKSNYKDYLDENSLEDNLKTPSFKQKIKGEIKGKRSKFIRDELNIKQKNLKNLDKYDNLEKKKQNKKINIRKRKEILDNKKNKKLNIETNPNNIKDKKIDKRCFSKPDNNIKKNKIYNTFNHNNINKNSKGNKSQIINKIMNIKNKINKDNGIKAIDDYDQLSIDSDEIILSDKHTNISQPFKQKFLDKKDINKSINTIIEDKNKNNINKNEQNEEKIYYGCDSTPNLFQNINLTFNQSIEKKRKLLGIPSNIKENLNKKMEEISEFEEKETKNLKENEIIEEKKGFKDKNNGVPLWGRTTPNNKPKRIIYDKRVINKYIKVKQKKQNEININNINSPYKETRYDNESYPSAYNNYNTNNIIYTQLYKNSNYKKNNFEDKDKKNANIASTSSLTSIFSTQTNKSNKVNNNLFKNKNKGNDYITKSNNNISHMAKIKNADISKSNNNIIVKKNENKNYLNTIRLIKKRDKNNNKENKMQKNEEKKEVNNYINTKSIKKDDNPKFYENEIKPRKELAVIRRINKKIENYKKNGPQVYQISKKHNNRFEENNKLNYFKGNNYQFHSFRRLNELKKRPKSNNSYRKISVSKSKSNKSLNSSIQKGNKSLKHFKI